MGSENRPVRLRHYTTPGGDIREDVVREAGHQFYRLERKSGGTLDACFERAWRLAGEEQRELREHPLASSITIFDRFVLEHLSAYTARVERGEAIEALAAGRPAYWTADSGYNHFVNSLLYSGNKGTLRQDVAERARNLIADPATARVEAVRNALRALIPINEAARNELLVVRSLFDAAAEDAEFLRIAAE